MTPDPLSDMTKSFQRRARPSILKYLILSLAQRANIGRTHSRPVQAERHHYGFGV